MSKFLLLFFVLMLVSCGDDTQSKEAGVAKELTLAHTFNDTHPVSAAYKEFSKKIEEATGGRYKIVVYGNAQLGEQRANMELTQSGSLDITSVYVGNLENVQPTYQVITSPYMFYDDEHYYKALASDMFREKIYNASLDKGFIGLTPMDAGTRNFYNKVRPINVPEDLKGLKFRVSESQTAIKLTEYLGGIPVMMPAGETYTALQQNLIDGGENNLTYLVSTRQAEIVKYYSYTEHTRIPDMLIMSTKAWEELSAEDQQIFLTVAKEVSDNFTKNWAVSESEFAKKAQENGVQINRIDDLEPFRALVQPMHVELMAQSADLKELVNHVNSLKNK